MGSVWFALSQPSYVWKQVTKEPLTLEDLNGVDNATYTMLKNVCTHAALLCLCAMQRDTLSVVLWCLLVCGVKIVGQGDIAVTTAEEYGAAFSDLTYSVRLLSGKQVPSTRAWAVACWGVIAQRVR